MRRFSLFLAVLILTLVLTQLMTAQFKDQGMGFGLQGGANIGMIDGTADKSMFAIRPYLRYPMAKSVLFGELGLTLTGLKGEVNEGVRAYKTELVNIDYRFLLSPTMASWNPYLFAGIGASSYNLKDPTQLTPADMKRNGWTAYVPMGLGLAFKLGENVALDFTGTYNYSFSNNLDGYDGTAHDSYVTIMGGITFAGESGKADPDKDGLTNDEEKQFGTDKKNPDTDGDGLKDGAEVKTYQTNPTKADTDGDGLNDGEEVNTYKTDPLKADTDGDGLNDGDEVTRYKTDPTKADTDGGTVNDGTEIARGTNPLDPNDDVPKAPAMKVGAVMTLEGITFATGKAVIEPSSEATLEKVLEGLKAYPDAAIEISGHTDNTGKRASNVKLSQQRADAVKAWFVAKGIDASRLTAMGYGPDKPVADNKTADGRAKNRRIEMTRTK